MRESHKSKRVSWASDVSLCQVRLFLSEESPSQVGLDSQDHLQAKTSWLSHSTGTGSDDVLPPGFEGSHPANLLQTKLSQISTVKWRCPPRFVLDLTWQVVGGDESEEAGIQNQREMRVLEAVYPRPSAIPPNPSVTLNAEDAPYDDGQTPSIPISPIEDEDVAPDVLSEPVAQYDHQISSQSLQQPFGVPSSSQHGATNMASPPVPEKQVAGTALGAAEPGFLASALTRLANINERGNLIDHELLIKILSNPKMVEKLVTDYGTTTNNNTQNTSISWSPLVAISDPPPGHVNRTPSSIPMSAAVSSGPLYPQPNGATMGHHPNSRLPAPPPSVSIPCPSHSHVAAPQKDMSYYKSLIQQHGGEKQEALPQYGNRYSHQPVTNQEPVNGHKPRESKPKIMKPCIYFNSSRGCRHGANCAYQHDASFQQRGSSMPEVQSAKRLKFDGEISS